MLFVGLMGQATAHGAGASEGQGDPDFRHLTPAARLVLELLQQSEQSVDVGTDALRLSALILPDVDVPKGVATLNEIAAKVAKIVGTNTDPDFRIRAMNTVLNHQLGFHFDTEELIGPAKLETPLLWNLLKTQRGNCAVLPLLWYAVAERLHYPVFLVTAPQHFFIRYDDGKYRSNVETTSGGGDVPDEKYIADMEISPEALKSGAFMRSMSKREIVAAMVSGIGERLLHFHNYGDAIFALQNSLVNYPQNIEANWNLALAFNSLGYSRAAEQVLTAEPEGKKKTIPEPPEFAKAFTYAAKAKQLGAPRPVTKDYWKKVQHLSEGKTGVKVASKPFDLVAALQPMGSRILVVAPPIEYPDRDSRELDPRPPANKNSFGSEFEPDRFGHVNGLGGSGNCQSYCMMNTDLFCQGNRGMGELPGLPDSVRRRLNVMPGSPGYPGYPGNLPQNYPYGPNPNLLGGRQNGWTP